MPANTASSAPRQAAAAPSRTRVAAHGHPFASTTAARGRALDARPSAPSVSSDTTATAA